MIDEDDDFPLHDGGRVLFKRDHFIKEVANMVLEKNKIGEYPSHYWRAPVGSGKSVFLKLLGRELASRGCNVYMLNTASDLESYPKKYFRDLAEQAGEKTVVLLIDEVQHNVKSKHWPNLLKEDKPANLVVLGVGVPELQNSPQFDKKYPKDNDLFPMFFTVDDLPEVVNYFAKRFPSHGEGVILEVCQKILTFTSGHPFPSSNL